VDPIAPVAPTMTAIVFVMEFKPALRAKHALLRRYHPDAVE